MTPTHHPRSRALFAALVLLGSALHAQSTKPPASTGSEQAVVLDPFTVKSTGDDGYRTQSSASGIGYTLPIDRIPIPLTVLTSQFLADSGSIKVEDALRYVSGVSNSGRTSSTESYVIRGFSTGNLLRDGEPFNSPTDTAIVDRVEVIKGPAAIIYGTSDPSGLVNVVQKQPHFKSETLVSAAYGEDGTYRGVLDFNQAFARSGEWRTAARLITAYYHDGFPRPNEFRERALITPAFHAEYGKNTAFDVRYNYTKEDGRLNRIQTPFRDTGEGGSVFARGFVPVTRDFTFVTKNDEWEHRDEGIALRLVQHLGPNTTFLASFVQSQIDAMQYFNLGNGRIQANPLGQYFAGGNRMVVEPRQSDHRGISFKLLHELNWGKANHKLSVGYRDNKDTEYSYAYYDGRVIANPVVLIADASGPKTVSFPGAPRSVFSPTDPNSVNLTGTTGNTNPNAVRVSNAYVSDYMTLLQGRLHLLAAAHFINIKSQDKDSVSPQFGAVFEVVPGINLYALTSESFKPNGPASTVNASLGFLEPEKGSGEEIGLKFSPVAGKLSGTLAFYQIKRENIVQFIGGVFDRNNNVPSGEERSEGVELDLVYTPTPNLSIMAAYAYTDAYISKAAITTDGNSPDANGDGVSDAVGLPKEGLAKHDVRLWASYGFAKNTALSGLSFGGGVTWRDGPIPQFPTYIHRFVLEESDPVRLDLFAAYRTKLIGRDTTVRVNWQNVTNEQYRDRRAYFVVPSTLTLTVDLRF